MSEGADIPIPFDMPPNARTAAQVVDLGDEEHTDGGLIVRASGEVLMGNPTRFDQAG